MLTLERTIRTRLPDVDDAWLALQDAVEKLSNGLARFESRDRLDEAFAEVADCATPIFRREEEVLQQLHDPLRRVHMEGHRRFLERLRSFRHDLRQQGATWELARAVRCELRDGLREHHAVMDALLGCSVTRSLGQDPALLRP